jgi:REP element-mobilizing transposase RayT
MARKPRIEIAGGLYHIITRGNNRKRIFRSHDDHLKFLRLFERQKAKLPIIAKAFPSVPISDLPPKTDHLNLAKSQGQRAKRLAPKSTTSGTVNSLFTSHRRPCLTLPPLSS